MAGEREVRQHAVERGVVRRGDQDRVDVAVAGAGRRRQRMTDARHRLARERQMQLVELERMQLRDGVERARSGGHQLGADAVAGQAGNVLPAHVVTTGWSEVVGYCALGSLLGRRPQEAHFFRLRVGVCGSLCRVSAQSP